MESTMKKRNRPGGYFCCWALLLGLLAPVALEAQTGDSSSDVNAKIDALQKQIESLQNELATVKQQVGETKSAAAASAPAASPAGPAPAAATTASAPAGSAPAAPAATTMATILGPLSVTGFVDGYYGYNFEHPHVAAPSVLAGNPGFFGAGNTTNTGLSGLRAFDSPYSQMSLNAAEVILDKPPDATNSRIGYHLALGFGNAMNVVGSTEPGGLGWAQYLKEAYGSYLAPIGKGLQIDFGKFVTPAGAEVIESKDNWNYSRGILFTYAIPFYHFGLRAKYAFNDKFALTGYVVNGWNNIVDNNTGKTYGFSAAWTPNKKVAVTENYLAGPEQFQNNGNWRQLSDTVITYSPTAKLSFILNYDYGRGDRLAAVANPLVANPIAWWSGVAGYIRYQANDKWAWSQRYEYYDDHSGFTTLTAQHINEFTETLERKLGGSFITRLEYRRDMTNQPSLFKGTTPVDHQDTIAMGLIYTFDLKELK